MFKNNFFLKKRDSNVFELFDKKLDVKKKYTFSFASSVSFNKALTELLFKKLIDFIITNFGFVSNDLNLQKSIIFFISSNLYSRLVSFFFNIRTLLSFDIVVSKFQYFDRFN